MRTLIAVSLFIAVLIPGAAQDINFEHIGASDGLSQISVMTIYQDELGYMWFGTREGLNRYDGRKIEVFQVIETEQDGLTSNIINKICGDGNGKLYIRCGYDQLVSYDLKDDRFQLMTENCEALASGSKSIWYATGNQIVNYDYITDTPLDYYIVDPAFPVQQLLEGSNGKLYIGTSRGVFLLDENKISNLLIPGTNVSAIFEDSRKNIWVGTSSDGVFKINRTGLIDRYTPANGLSSNIIRDFTEDNFGQIWIATFMGLNKLNPETGAIKSYTHTGNKPTELSHPSVYSLYNDRQGTLWAGTYFGGVNYVNPEANIYTYFYPTTHSATSVNYPIIGNMTEDRDGNIWICTEGGGLNFFDRKLKTFRYFKAGGENSIAHNNLKCIWYNEKNHRLYIGTHMGGLSIYDINRQQFSTINTSSHPALGNNVIVAFQPYGEHLLVLTQSTIVQLDMNTNSISPFVSPHKKRIPTGSNFTAMLIDSKKNLWLETNDDLKKINLQSGEIKSYSHSFDKPGSIGRHGITRIYEDRRGRLLFASIGSGLFQYLPDKDLFVRYSQHNNGLLSDFIYDITETTYGYLILLTNKGINFFDPDNNKNQYLDRSRGLPLEMSNYGNGIYSTRNGEIFAGGINGMVSFFENQISPINKEYSLFFSRLILNNKVVKPGDKDKVLSGSLPYLKKISLKYWQNNFSIEFASSNFIKANTRDYEYMLEGLDDEWSPTREQTIRYTNLSPGKYKLKLRETASLPLQETPRTIELEIRIRPPFYASFVAYLVYFLLIVFIIVKINAFNNSKIKLKTSLEFERREKERIEELNQTKLQFFTNISHEFRTPLTLIIGQIETMLQLENLAPALHNKLVKVYKNAAQLRNLISELLDFRKQERDLLTLKVSNQDLVSFVHSIFLSFNEMAASRSISYSFNSVEKSSFIWMDPVQLQKVFYNLISNAFKYTPDNGKINILLEPKSDKMLVRIKDSGAGVPAGDIERIFERFYQSPNRVMYGHTNFSTGVGLALSKGIINLHHGEIDVQNNAEGGTTFTVTLLKGSEHFSDTEKSQVAVVDLKLSDTELPDREFIETYMEKFSKANKTDCSILIVEDNEEMLQFLSEVFASIYHVETSCDGRDALEKLKTIQPDIILSDVMMPVMNGKELCSLVKNNFDTSHIPVVLLTADSSEEQNLEGLMIGADDYITKPFNVKVLISRCNNLVLNRKNIQEKYLKQTDVTPVSLATNKLDQTLLDKATEIVVKHLDDSNFDVTRFASEMALGRSKLYLKIKGVTGLTPNDFIQNIRLKHAAMLLKTEHELNISDITYRLGFSTPRYFSKCFKELFGISPLHYRKLHNPVYSNKEDDESEELD